MKVIETYIVAFYGEESFEYRKLLETISKEGEIIFYLKTKNAYDEVSQKEAELLINQ